MDFPVLFLQWLGNYGGLETELLHSETGIFSLASSPFFSFVPPPPIISFLVSLAAGTDTSFFVLAHKSLCDQGTRKLLGVRGRSGQKFRLI